VRSLLFDLLVGAGVAGLASLGFVSPDAPAGMIALGYVMAVAVVFRRRWPLVTMGIVAGVALLQVLLFPPRFDPAPYDVALLVAMYSAVKYGRRLRDGIVAGAVVAVGIVIEAIRHPELSITSLLLFYVGLCGGVWLMGYSMRNRRIYVETLEERATTLEREREHLARLAVADERAAIARELHDVVAHSLAVMIVQADGGSYAIDNDPAQARQALKTVADTGREALADMQRLVGVLRGPRLEPDGDEARIPVTPDRLDLLVERARTAGLSVDLAVSGSSHSGPASLEAGWPTLPPTVALVVYRIVQEALTNVLRHAGHRAQVRLRLGFAEDAVSVSVLDDGGGADRLDEGEAVRERPGGHGLVGMRERVNVHGGHFAAGPTGSGWSVEAAIPLPAPAKS
jgi:signal transduction histidine kinase